MAHPEGEQPTDLEELMKEMGGLYSGLVGPDGEMEELEGVGRGELSEKDTKREKAFLLKMAEIEKKRKEIGDTTVTLGSGKDRVVIFLNPLFELGQEGVGINAYTVLEEV